MKNSGFKRKTASLRAKTGFKRSVSSLRTRRPLVKRTRTSSKKEPSETLDKIFSEYVRRFYADERGYVTCITCKSRAHWRNVDCGHFMKRGNLNTRYEFSNVSVQCRECNRFNNGEDKKFAEEIDRIYGEGYALELKKYSMIVAHNFPWQEKITEFTNRLNALVERQTNQIEY